MGQIVIAASQEHVGVFSLSYHYIEWRLQATQAACIVCVASVAVFWSAVNDFCVSYPDFLAQRQI